MNKGFIRQNTVYVKIWNNDYISNQSPWHQDQQIYMGNKGSALSGKIGQMPLNANQ